MISTHPPTEPPPSGTLLLFDRNRTLFYKSDGYEWVKKKKNPSKVREDHTKLRINGQPRLGGLHAHCVMTPSLHRRCYYQLDPKTGKTRYPYEYPGTTANDNSRTHVTSLILMQYLDIKGNDMATQRSSPVPERNNPITRPNKSWYGTSKTQKAIKAQSRQAKLQIHSISNLREKSVDVNIDRLASSIEWHRKLCVKTPPSKTCQIACQVLSTHNTSAFKCGQNYDYEQDRKSMNGDNTKYCNFEPVPLTCNPFAAIKDDKIMDDLVNESGETFENGCATKEQNDVFTKNIPGCSSHFISSQSKQFRLSGTIEGKGKSYHTMNPKATDIFSYSERNGSHSKSNVHFFQGEKSSDLLITGKTRYFNASKNSSRIIFTTRLDELWYTFMML